jgi:hypothetical protein
MNLRKGIQRACEMQGINISKLEYITFGLSKGRSRIQTIIGANRYKNGPCLGTLEKIAGGLDMPLSQLIKLCEAD